MKNAGGVNVGTVKIKDDVSSQYFNAILLSELYAVIYQKIILYFNIYYRPVYCCCQAGTCAASHGSCSCLQSKHTGE